MPKRTLLILVVLIFLTLLVFVAAALFVLPYTQAACSMPPNGELTLHQQTDGSVIVSWPTGRNVEQYRLEIVQTADNSVIYRSAFQSQTSHTLPSLPSDQELTIRVSCLNTYNSLLGSGQLRLGDEALEVTATFLPPTVSGLRWEMDANAKTVDIFYDDTEDGACTLHYYLEDGTTTQLDNLTGGKTTLTFGEGKDFPLPTAQVPHVFGFSGFSQGDGYIFYGTTEQKLTVTRDDMLGTVLELSYTELGNNVYKFTWNATLGTYYEFQHYNTSTGQWLTLAQLPNEGDLSYTTSRLARYSEYRFRVIAAGGDELLPDSEFAATPAEMKITTGTSAIYCTIWPIRDLTVYSDAQRTSTLGTAKAADAYCILDAENGMFLIRFGEEYGYIDSNYCMINLPEFLGSICLYDISNSYASLFMAHEYEIPSVTDEVIVGYESVQLADDSFLVPLLYPTALKLEEAAFNAMAQDCILKIYDSYRPRVATESLYNLAASLADKPIPERTFSGVPVTDLKGDSLTYRQLMTDNGRYSLSYFLAAGGSRHNQGVAVDLTLVDLGSGEEMQMQTSMHDLSWYSELDRNNSSANMLSRLMREAGFAGLTSEWWHFQDDEIRASVNLPYMREGVNPECWMADNMGWRYRDETGKFLKNCSATIDGVMYTFDKDGYVS